MGLNGHRHEMEGSLPSQTFLPFSPAYYRGMERLYGILTSMKDGKEKSPIGRDRAGGASCL